MGEKREKGDGGGAQLNVTYVRSSMIPHGIKPKTMRRMVKTRA